MILRHLKPEDIPVIEALHQANRKKEGLAYGEFPDLRDPKSAFALVVEDKGKITGAIVFHSVVEAIAVGDRAKVFPFALSRHRAMRKLLKQAGITKVYAWVPRKHRRSMGKSLKRAGFIEVPPDFVDFLTEVA